jgi:hypothetical protein
MLQLGLRAFLYWCVWWVGGIVGVVFVLIVEIATRSPAFGGVLLALGGGVVGLALLIAYWFTKVPIQISGWNQTIEWKGTAAPQVLSHIGSVLAGRQTPLDSVQVQRLELPGLHGGPRDYLELRSSIFYGYVACFAYGTDLYVGWTFWVRISPFWYLLMFYMRFWQTLMNKGDDLHTSLRYDTARAMRGTMHSAVCEGVDLVATLP